MPRTAHKLDRYIGRSRDPQLLEVWKKALSETVKIKISPRAKAQRLRFKLYELRLILQAEEDPLYQSLRHLSISTTLDHSSGEFTLTISPQDADIKDQLAKQGFGETLPEEDSFFNPEE